MAKISILIEQALTLHFPSVKIFSGHLVYANCIVPLSSLSMCTLINPQNKAEMHLSYYLSFFEMINILEANIGVTFSLM